MSMFRMCRGAWCAVALIVLCCAAPARAVDPLVSWWKGEVNGWVFAPAHTAGGTVVLGFLAWAQPGVTVGDNISVLWYERGQDDLWRVWGWKTGDFTSAVAYARNVVANPTLWADDPEILARMGPAGQEPVPTELEFGFFVDDPNAPTFLAQPQPVEVVEAITAAGYPTAPTLSAVAVNDEQMVEPVNCLTSEEVNTAVVLNRLTFEAETAMFGSSTLLAAQVGEICCWCPCSTFWVYQPWVYLGDSYVNGVRHCKYTAEAQKIRRCLGLFLASCNACDTRALLATARVYGYLVKPEPGDCPEYGGTGTIPDNPPNIITELPSWW